jgi:hypothetical protein
MPQRIRLSRAKGWRKPAGAIVVARPTKWGNPWRVKRWMNGWAVFGRGEFTWVDGWAEADARAEAVAKFSRLVRGTTYARQAEIELAGHDLCCWCPLDQPCHAAVLLDIANQGGAQK